MCNCNLVLKNEDKLKEYLSSLAELYKGEPIPIKEVMKFNFKWGGSPVTS